MELMSVGVKASHDYVSIFGIMRTDSTKYTSKKKRPNWPHLFLLFNLIDKAVMVLTTICTDSGLYTLSKIGRSVDAIPHFLSHHQKIAGLIKNTIGSLIRSSKLIDCSVNSVSFKQYL